jgi:S-formylglutathione hydrolase FrmB
VLDWALLSGPVPVALRLLAVVTAGWLVLWRIRRRGRAVLAEVGVCLLVATAATAALDYLVRDVWELFPDRLDMGIYLWVVLAVAALCLAAKRVLSRPRRLRRSVGMAAAAVVVVAACANQVNAAFGAYLTPRAALDPARADDIALPDRDVRVLPDADPVSSQWSAPPGLPVRGKVASAPIPGRVSGFAARHAEIYLPPAYFADPRPQLPVLVLLAGQPGAPEDWFNAGRLAQIMDGFAAAHVGLAPVVVVADATGSRFDNPLCVDSRRGRVDTYLATDVPAWINTHLTVDADPQSWAVGGISYGGTCALQLATNHPGIYTTFVDISGSAEPSLGDQRRTIAEVFGGDRDAYRRVNPLDLLRRHPYRRSAGAIVVGAADRDTRPDARLVYAATSAAGMDTHYTEVPGSHDWHAFAGGLTRELPWLAARIGLTGARA